jgi:hypothetical protein
MTDVITVDKKWLDKEHTMWTIQYVQRFGPDHGLVSSRNNYRIWQNESPEGKILNIFGPNDKAKGPSNWFII